MTPVKQLKLGIALSGASDDRRAEHTHAPGLRGVRVLAFYRSLAKEAEAARLDFISVSHELYFDPDAAPPVLGGFEPITLLSALATVTSHIGLISAQATGYADPYTVARQMASLDNLSKGRAGWNVVATEDAKASQNFTRIKPMDPGERYRQADEHLAVVRGLWDSWEDEAFLYDRTNRLFFDAKKLHTLNHTGPFYSVKGPLNITRSRQGQPVIVHDGRSGDAREFGARVADIVYTHERSLMTSKNVYDDMKAQASRHGRAPEHVLVMPCIAPVIAFTGEKYLGAGGALPDAAFVGTPEKIVGDFELWIGEGAADGFILNMARGEDLSVFSDLVLPLLRSKGLFRSEYDCGTLRGNLGIAIPANRYATASA